MGEGVAPMPQEACETEAHMQTHAHAQGDACCVAWGRTRAVTLVSRPERRSCPPERHVLVCPAGACTGGQLCACAGLSCRGRARALPRCGLLCAGHNSCMLLNTRSACHPTHCARAARHGHMLRQHTLHAAHPGRRPDVPLPADTRAPPSPGPFCLPGLLLLALCP